MLPHSHRDQPVPKGLIATERLRVPHAIRWCLLVEDVREGLLQEGLALAEVEGHRPPPRSSPGPSPILSATAHHEQPKPGTGPKRTAPPGIPDASGQRAGEPTRGEPADPQAGGASTGWLTPSSARVAQPPVASGGG